MFRSRTMACAVSIVGLVAGASMQAEAACTRLAFSVNDYGKDGPTKDAKELLDKYIKKWTSDRGIKSYTTGTKSVTCELFLDFIVFDEYTCKASASVCWSGSMPKTAAGEAVAPAAGQKASNSNERRAPAANTAIVKAPAAAPVATGSVVSQPVRAPASTSTPAAPKPPVVETVRDVAPSAPAPVLVPPLPPAKGGD